MEARLKSAILKRCESPADILIDIITELLSMIEYQQAALLIYSSKEDCGHMTSYYAAAVTEKIAARLEKLGGHVVSENIMEPKKCKILKSNQN